MKRRQFSSAAATLIGAAGLVPLAPSASAQGAPVEGRHYVRLTQPLPINVPPGKIEVIEFFWFGCPHCAAFEPELDAWARKLPEQVVFSRVPVAFRPEPFTTHQRIFYALEALGAVETMHRKVFYAIHNDRMRLAKPDEIAAFMGKNGIDSAKFLETYNSFSVQTKVGQAKQLAQAYKIDAVPAMGVQGRYFINGTMAGSNDRMTAVADALIERVRKGA